LILVLGFLRSPGPSGVAILTVAAGVPAFYFFRKKYRLPMIKEATDDESKTAS
jgi:hypothetical protein